MERLPRNSDRDSYGKWFSYLEKEKPGKAERGLHQFFIFFYYHYVHPLHKRR